MHRRVSAKSISIPTATTNDMEWLASSSSPLSSPTLTAFDSTKFSSPSIASETPPSPAFPSFIPSLPSSRHSRATHEAFSNSFLSSNSHSYARPSTLFGQASSDSHLRPSALRLPVPGRQSVSPPPGWDPRNLHSMARIYFTFL